MSLLQARGLTLRFGGECPLFESIDFDISPGDCIAVVGPNGAGKSSLLRVLAGVQPPDDGRILRRRGLVLSYFPQAGTAADGETICDWPLAGEVEPMLRGLGFDTDDFHLPLAQLSAGQHSRAYLARALAAPAALLLLDEPTNHLVPAPGRGLSSI